MRAAYLVEMHRAPDLADIFLMLILVVMKGNEERLVQLTSLELNSPSPLPAPAVRMPCLSPDAPLLDHCHHGIQFYGTRGRGVRRVARHAPPRDGRDFFTA